MSNTKKIKIKNNVKKECTLCNPQKYLKFNFSFATEYGEPTSNDICQFFEKLKFLSSEMYSIMIYKYSGNKSSFIEEISTKQLDIKKQIPTGFRDIFPVETNEKYAIFRLYSAGKPSGSGNSRIIGMIKNTIFYIFYIDWKGTLYKH